MDKEKTLRQMSDSVLQYNEEEDHTYIICNCGETLWMQGEYEYGFYFSCPVCKRTYV